MGGLDDSEVVDACREDLGMRVLRNGNGQDRVVARTREEEYEEAEEYLEGGLLMGTR